MKALTFVAVMTALATFAIARAGDAPVKKAAEAPAAEAKTEGKKPSKATCKAGDDERSVEVQAGESGGCKVVYTNAGAAKTVGEAVHQLDFCDQLMERMIRKFEGAGFQCQ